VSCGSPHPPPQATAASSPVFPLSATTTDAGTRSPPRHRSSRGRWNRSPSHDSRSPQTLDFKGMGSSLVSDEDENMGLVSCGVSEKNLGPPVYLPDS
jgi:hypothetical protein